MAGSSPAMTTEVSERHHRAGGPWIPGSRFAGPGKVEPQAALFSTAYCLLPTAYCLLPTAYCPTLFATRHSPFANPIRPPSRIMQSRGTALYEQRPPE